MPKIQFIKIASILNKFDVRTKLDEDRVLQFAGLYEAGVDLPPVKIVELDDDKYAYVDGRHRGAARSYLNLEEVPAIVLTTSLAGDPAAIYAEALKSNWGGAKPPTRDDIAHTVTRMMELGVTQKEIKEHLTFLPKSSCDLYIQWAKGVLHKRRITGALDAVAEGMTAVNAATMFKLNPDTVKDAIIGKKRKWGKDRSDEQQLANELKGYISKSLRSANSGIAQKMEDLLKKVDNGEVSSSVASGVVNAWKEHLRKTNLRVDDWLARIDALSIPRDSLIKSEETVEHVQ